MKNLKIMVYLNDKCNNSYSFSNLSMKRLFQILLLKLKIYNYFNNELKIYSLEFKCIRTTTYKF